MDIKIDDEIRKSFNSAYNSINAFIKDEKQIETIKQVSILISGSLKNNHKVIWFGNGGSASQAEHLSAELSGRFKYDRKSYPSIALTANSAAVTAIANDYDYSDIFSRQVEGLCSEGDVCIGLSTSGKSKNVLNGLKIAKQKKAITVGLTGMKGLAMGDYVDYLIVAPSEETEHIQEIHIIAGHMICGLVEKILL